MTFSFELNPCGGKTFPNVKGSVCHFVVLGRPLSDKLMFWCGERLARSIKRDDTVSGDPDQVTCPSCLYCMQSSLMQRDALDVWSRPIPNDPVKAWLRSGDCGISSQTIWHVLSGTPMDYRFTAGIPYDPSDFGRCYRLLKRFPGWRERLGAVSARYPAWEVLVKRWGALEALYEAEIPDGTGEAPKLYEALQGCSRVPV